jgi:hypothetical protein
MTNFYYAHEPLPQYSWARLHYKQGVCGFIRRLWAAM